MHRSRPSTLTASGGARRPAPTLPAERASNPEPSRTIVVARCAVVRGSVSPRRGHRGRRRARPRPDRRGRHQARPRPDRRGRHQARPRADPRRRWATRTSRARCPSARARATCPRWSSLGRRWPEWWSRSSSATSRWPRWWLWWAVSPRWRSSTRRAGRPTGLPPAAAKAASARQGDHGSRGGDDESWSVVASVSSGRWGRSERTRRKGRRGLAGAEIRLARCARVRP